MKSFEYATPRTVDEAVEQLADKWGETEVLAGGTDLVTCLKCHQQRRAVGRLPAG